MASKLIQSGYKKLTQTSSTGTIVDYSDHLSKNFLTKLMNKVKTGAVLN